MDGVCRGPREQAAGMELDGVSTDSPTKQADLLEVVEATNHGTTPEYGMPSVSKFHIPNQIDTYPVIIKIILIILMMITIIIISITEKPARNWVGSSTPSGEELWPLEFQQRSRRFLVN